MNEDKNATPITALERLKAWKAELQANKNRQTWEDLELIKKQLEQLELELDQIKIMLDEDSEEA